MPGLPDGEKDPPIISFTYTRYGCVDGFDYKILSIFLKPAFLDLEFK